MRVSRQVSNPAKVRANKECIALYCRAKRSKTKQASRPAFSRKGHNKVSQQLSGGPGLPLHAQVKTDEKRTYAHVSQKTAFGAAQRGIKAKGQLSTGAVLIRSQSETKHSGVSVCGFNEACDGNLGWFDNTWAFLEVSPCRGVFFSSFFFFFFFRQAPLLGAV